MAYRANQVKFASLALLALTGTAGTFVFGILAGEGGKYHLLIILLGVLCASAPVVATAIGRTVTNRLLRTEVEARERAVEEREHALASKEVAERQTTEVQITAEARLIFALRARLSPVLYCLGKIAAAAPGVPVDPLVGSLTQAIVSAAVEHRHAAADRRSIFFAIDNGVMRCVSYAGYEGQRNAARTTFTDTPDDPVGQQMFRLLAEQEARLIPDLADPSLPVRFPRRRSYQTIIAAAVTADQARYGVLTLDAPEPDSLGQPDLEIMKTLANLLAVGLALAARIDKSALKVPAQGKREVMRSADLLPAGMAH
ncbi:MAG TPA: GAF domain-containing protein [Streptosporangiaceae bacterium]